MDGSSKYTIEGSYHFKGLNEIERDFNNLEDAQEFFLLQAKQHRAGRLNKVIDAPDETQYKLTGLDYVMKGKFHLSMYNEWTPNNFNKLGSEYGVSVQTFPKAGNDFSGSRELIDKEVFVLNDAIKDAYKDKPVSTYQIKKHKFKNKEIEKRYSDAETTSQETGESFIETVTKGPIIIKNLFTRKPRWSF